jgi:RNA polymerase sigma-70 factor (ECF subfamily)
MSTVPRDVSGELEARYRAFLETITHLRPSLHRYCARMTGSVLDGEDVVQEALFQAFRKLETFDGQRPLAPWLFRIAHNRCIDFLRRRGVRDEAEVAAASPGITRPVDPAGPEVNLAVEHLVLTLPPKERACVLLKDVFDYSLEDIADLVDSTVGGVKAALHRGRSKLASHAPAVVPARAENGKDVELLHLYVERFNHRDWDGLRELIAADARLHVADRWVGRVADSPYFGNYERVAVPWRLEIGDVEREPAVIIMRGTADGWSPAALVRLESSDGRIIAITDYWHCPWMLPAASSVVLRESS